MLINLTKTSIYYLETGCKGQAIWHSFHIPSPRIKRNLQKLHIKDKNIYHTTPFAVLERQDQNRGNVSSKIGMNFSEIGKIGITRVTLQNILNSWFLNTKPYIYPQRAYVAICYSNHWIFENSKKGIGNLKAIYNLSHIKQYHRSWSYLPPFWTCRIYHHCNKMVEFRHLCRCPDN